MKLSRIQCVQLTEVLQIVVIVLALGHLLLPSVALAHYIGPVYILDDCSRPSYSIVCRDICTVYDIKHDGAITSYRITGPLPSAELRRRFRICVGEEQLSLVTYEIKNKGKGFFGRSTAKIGDVYCI